MGRGIVTTIEIYDVKIEFTLMGDEADASTKI